MIEIGIKRQLMNIDANDADEAYQEEGAKLAKEWKKWE